MAVFGLEDEEFIVTDDEDSALEEEDAQGKKEDDEDFEKLKNGNEKALAFTAIRIPRSSFFSRWRNDI